MKYLKSYKLFEFQIFSDDDSESLARFKVFESNAQLGFSFGKKLITDKSEINDLIKEYNRTYNKNNEWSGGPVNTEFIEYFREKYGIGDRKDWKPTISLIIDIKDFSKFSIGYSIITKLPVVSGSWAYETGEDVPDQDDLKAEDVFWFYSNKVSLGETIDALSLDVTNMIDWTWVEKEKPKNEFNY